MRLFGLTFWKARPAMAAAEVTDETSFLVLDENRLKVVPRSELNEVQQQPGGVSLPWSFDPATDATSIAAADLRLNNAAAASATAIILHETALLAIGAANVLGLLLKGMRIILRKRYGDGSQIQIFKFVSAVDSGAYRTLTVTHVFGNGEFADGDEVLLTILPSALPAVPADNVTKVLRSVNGVPAWDGVDFDKTALAGYNAGVTQTLKHISGTLTWVTDA